MKKIILASASPRRKMLLKQIGLKFKVVISGVDEKLNPKLKPVEQAGYISAKKAQAVAALYENALIIAADTTVVVDQEVLGKAKDEKDAIRMLRKLNGRMHTVVTGFTIIDTDSRKKVTRSIMTKVWFRKLTDVEISDFVRREKPFDQAGAYSINGLTAVIIEKIEGDYFSALGLPLYKLAKELKKFGVAVL